MARIKLKGGKCKRVRGKACLCRKGKRYVFAKTSRCKR